MPQSRREFVAGLAALGAMYSGGSLLGSALGTSAGALDANNQGDGAVDISIGYSAIAWHDQDALAIQDLAALGFPGIQLRANALQDFRDPHALRDLLAQHRLTFVALSSGSAPLDPGLRQTTIAAHVTHAKYLREAGGSFLQIVPGAPNGKGISAEDFRYEGELLTEIGKRVAALGLQVSLHNHMGTMGQTPDGMDAILDAADAQYVKLELDTAHYLQGGGDPAAAIRRYGKRLLFLHLKDVRDASTKSGYEFVELGQGRVDFPAVFKALNAIRFRGWGIIELDGERTGVIHTPTESAEISKRYLEERMGVPIRPSPRDFQKATKSQ